MLCMCLWIRTNHFRISNRKQYSIISQYSCLIKLRYTMIHQIISKCGAYPFQLLPLVQERRALNGVDYPSIFVKLSCIRFCRRITLTIILLTSTVATVASRTLLGAQAQTRQIASQHAAFQRFPGNNCNLRGPQK